MNRIFISGNLIRVPVEQLKSGVYLIRLEGDEGVVTRRFVKD
jgi:hypothetical protein